MKLKELKQQITSLLAGGMKKSEGFELVCQQGAKPGAAAKLIASYADPARCAAHRGKVKVLVGIMCFLVMICFISGYFTGMDKGQGGSWIFAILMAIIPAAFAQGFYRNSASAYNIYLILTIIQLPRAFEGFTQTPVLSASIIGLNLALLYFVFYLRQQLFPDFVLITPKKVDGRYVFSE